VRVTLGQYLPGDSFVHRTDPRVKLFLMGLGIGTAFRMDSPVELAAFSLVAMFLGLISQVPFGKLLAGLRPFLWLFAFTALLHVFMTPGDPISWLPHATWQGLTGGTRVGLQLVFAIWLSTLTTLTTSPLDMVWAMEWYMKPLKYLKVPVDEIALLIMLAIRFIPILFEETDRIPEGTEGPGRGHRVGLDIQEGALARAHPRAPAARRVPASRRPRHCAHAAGLFPGHRAYEDEADEGPCPGFPVPGLASSVFLALIWL
jgi:energy-coupling factor transport system permease protein